MNFSTRQWEMALETPSAVLLTSAISAHIAHGPCKNNGKSPKTGSKRRTDLKIWPSKANIIEEFDLDVKTHPTPAISAKGDEN